MTATLFLTALLLAPMAAQEEPLVLRSTTTLVQVNVVVQTKKREPVADLKAEDFTILEKGKPQKIAFFSAEQATRISASESKLPPNVFSNRFAERTGVPASVTVILLDMLNTAWTDQANARRHVMRVLSQIRPEDRVGLYTLGRDLRVLHDYTTDSAALVARLNKWPGQALPQLEDSKPDPEMLERLAAAGLSTQLEIQTARFTVRNRILNTLAALEAIARHLGGVPGRKSLVWVSGSFPLSIGHEDIRNPGTPRRRQFEMDQRTYLGEMEQAARTLNHSNIAVYPVDARGLVAGLSGSATAQGGMSTQAFAPENLDTMLVLAARTGGKAYINRNDIDGSLREVFNEAALTYTLGYYPSDPPSGGKWRDIQVKVNRQGVNVRHRKGYFGFEEIAEADTELAKSQLREAVWSPLDATALGLHARVDPIPAKNGYRVTMQIDASSVTLKQQGDRWTGRVDVAIVTKGADGRTLDAASENIGMNLERSTYEQALKGGILYERLVPTVEGAASLRIVARDVPSGLAGSVTVPVGKIQTN